MTEPRTIQLDHATAWLPDGNIIRVGYKKNFHLELRSAWQIAETIRNICVCLRMSIADTHNIPTDDHGVNSLSWAARTHFAGESGTPSAGAALVNSRLGEIIRNFPVMVGDPQYPNELFVRHKVAVQQLKKLRAEAS